tara:strand:- start:793 stop:993 length:201 start_codon:yes stop_codon:yes gene_type:complete
MAESAWDCSRHPAIYFVTRWENIGCLKFAPIKLPGSVFKPIPQSTILFTTTCLKTPYLYSHTSIDL